MTVRILTGDCRDVLATLDEGSVHCVVTSPPYFGLRDYGHAGQIGLEPTPADFVAALVEAMRGVWRVLRDDGVAWVVLGDSFAATGKSGGGKQGEAWSDHGADTLGPRGGKWSPAPPGNKPGDLLMIPARVALALQADGWTLRQVVTWAKVSCMPESVAGTRWEKCRVKIDRQSGPVCPRDTERYGNAIGWTPASHPQTRTPATYAPCPGCPRCTATDSYVLRRGSWRHTSATEQVLMLTKGMGYWADQEAVREAAADSTAERSYLGKRPESDRQVYMRDNGMQGAGNSLRDYGRSGRNPRNWVTPSPSPFPGAHFATYPPALIEPFIRATCPAKCCPTCGAGRAAVVERSERPHVDPSELDRYGTGEAGVHRKVWQAYQNWRDANPDKVIAYRPTCACPPADPVPGTVLDPFLGAGTTALVADRLGRDCIGIELNPDYAKMAAERIRGDAPLFHQVPAP